MGQEALKSYIAATAVLAVALAASWAYWFGLPSELSYLPGTAIAAGLLVLADRFPLRINDRHEISALAVALVASVALLGPICAAVAMLPCAVVAGGGDWLRSAYEASRSTVEVFVAGMAFSFASSPLLTGEPASTATAVYATFAAAAALSATNHLVNAGLLKVKHGQGFGESWSELVVPYLLPDGVAVLTAGFSVLALLTYGPAAALVLVVGSIVGQALVYSARENHRERIELASRNRELEEALEGAGEAFGSMVVRDLGKRDGYTHLHAAATAVYARDIAVELELSEERARRVRIAGLLHNIGLFGLPDGLLLASGRINSVARQQLAEHVLRGQEMLGAVSGYEDIAGWVRWHHERPDGRGYPGKLRGPWIPVEAKILHAAQAYAAMVLDQPRRPGLGFEEARKELSAGMGSQFDETVAKAFLRVLDTSPEGYRMADDHRFAFPNPFRDSSTPSPYSEAGSEQS